MIRFLWFPCRRMRKGGLRQLCRGGEVRARPTPHPFLGGQGCLVSWNRDIEWVVGMAILGRQTSASQVRDSNDSLWTWCPGCVDRSLLQWTVHASRIQRRASHVKRSGPRSIPTSTMHRLQTSDPNLAHLWITSRRQDEADQGPGDLDTQTTCVVYTGTSFGCPDDRMSE